MPDLRPTCLIGDRHAGSETHPRSTIDMRDRRSIGDRHAGSENRQRPTCLIGDPSVTNMPDQRPTLCKICISYGSGIWVSNEACRSLIRHVGLRSDTLVPDEACRSPMSMSVSDQHVGLRSIMSVSDGSSIRHLRWVSDNNNIFLNSGEIMYYVGINKGVDRKDGYPSNPAWIARCRYCNIGNF